MVRMIKYRTRLNADKRVELEKELVVNRPDLYPIIKTPDDAAIIGREFMRIHEEPEEYMYMLCLNNKNRVTGIFEISHGNVNSSIVGPREVFQKALLANAVNIILMHNHPSGDPSPSNEDIKVTKRLTEVGDILGVRVLDHLIIGDRYVSLKEKGYL